VLPRRPRLQTFAYIGRYRYFLTFCTKDRHSAFAPGDVVSFVGAEIFKASSQCEFAVSAYVFMPDHVHLLVEGCSDACELKRFASLAKQRSAFVYSRAKDRQLWQPSYYDHILRPEESSLPVMHYMLQNPVRAGLVEDWIDYPHLDPRQWKLTKSVAR
jgi:REP-associated tyrosine transposase